ncbi:hypothetical protein [Chryseobacterium sp.]|uniref:hypothetical protein n=1 Tax=Chryseobacterium sp. TaxID=1871047 RepID=UPI0025C01845|nr:hypothetical protein [Chryseobacterium sp.]MBV8325155.1 hypothetical protein [Chryseobacterium sp.]
MKKKIFTLIVLASAGCIYAQVGINTQTPAATLDVVGKKDGKKPDGTILPRLSGDDLKTADNASPKLYTTAQKGTIAYVTSPVTSPASPQTVNLKGEGYYYFDGNIWQKFIKGPFTYQTYTLTNVNQDWVANYNTLLDAKKYTMLILGSTLQLPSNAILATDHNRSTSPTATNVYDFFGATNVAAVKQGPSGSETWRLQADYVGAGPRYTVDTTDPDGTKHAAGSTANGTWKIYTLIIDQSQVTQNTDIQQDLGGNSTATASAPPVTN